MIQIKDIISYLRFNEKRKDKIVFGYYDRILKKIIYRDFRDIEKFNSSYFFTFNEYDGKDLTIPISRIREFKIDNELVWWRHPETNINDYGCTIK